MTEVMSCHVVDPSKAADPLPHHVTDPSQVADHVVDPNKVADPLRCYVTDPSQVAGPLESCTTYRQNAYHAHLLQVVHSLTSPSGHGSFIVGLVCYGELVGHLSGQYSLL